MSAICAGLGSKGKVGVQRGRKTAGCPSFLPTAVGTASSPRSAERSSSLRFSEKLPARQGRTRLRQFVCPGQPVQQKEPPVRGEPACGSSCAPVSRCRKKRAAPSGSNPPVAVRVPRSAGAEKEPPVRGEHANAVRVPRSPWAEKRKAPQNCFHGAQSMHFYSNRSSVSTSLRAGACGSCAG